METPFGDWRHCLYCWRRGRTVPAPRWRGFRGGVVYFLCDACKQERYASFDYVGDMGPQL